MQSIFQKENADKALKYRLYRHLPAYEKIIRNLVRFSTEKETVRDSKEKDGAGLWWVSGRPRRLASLHTGWGPATAVTCNWGTA